MKKKRSSWKLATQISAFITIVTLTGLLFLWILTSNSVIALIRDNITNQMYDTVESRAAIINDYVTSAEEYMMAFALGDEVQELLQNPDDPALVERAQRYTEDFADIKGIFEGLYIATPQTHVLTHTSQQAIGMTTRTGDSLTEFQNTILSRQKLTNLGIMVSPGTGNMIISMYYPLFREDECIGYVGAGVYADQLMDSLLELEIQGLPNSEYIFLNAETGVYLYHEDESLLNTQTTDANMLEVIRQVQAGNVVGAYSGPDGSYIVYKYLADRGWIFMVQDSQSEIFHDVFVLRVLIGAVCILVAVLIIIVTLLRLRSIGRHLMSVEIAIGRLGRLELSVDRELENLTHRGDEIGMIARTTSRLSGILRDVIKDIERILVAIANGDLTVDAVQNESLYIGDFTLLSDSLKVISAKLIKLIGNIYTVSGQVTAGAGQISSEAQMLLQGTMEQVDSAEELVSVAGDISEHINKNAAHASEAQKQAAEMALKLESGKEQMSRMKEAMADMNRATEEIHKIIKTIEDIATQTNILSLNASIEAQRAGAAGKGFAVVANQVRILAGQSDEASKSTAELIESLINAVHKGSEITDAMVASLSQGINMSETTADLVNEISAASAEQAKEITQVTQGIDQISAVAQTNSSNVQKSVEVSRELAGQANTLEGLVSKFQLKKS